jgi:hypothetical protein
MMNKLWISALILVSIAHAQDMNTTTTTTFGDRIGAGLDGHGNQLYTQDVTIKTEDYEVNNFWTLFFNPNNKKKHFTQLSTTATAQLSVEASSACSIAGKGQLPAQGCSGQKPFLVNDEAVNGLVDGASISLIFQPVKDDTTGALLYTNGNVNVLYPMDIGRVGEYYQSAATVQAGSKKTFFSFFTGIFDFFFDQMAGVSFFGTPKIADVKYGTRAPEAEDRRQRYIANIIGGVDQSHLLSMPYKSDPATQINAQTRLNNPASLLHYAEAKKTTDADQCKFMFLNLSSDGLMCRMMTGFGMNAWMPFFTSAKVTEVDVNTITIDTENALLAAAGQVSGVSYQKVTGTTDTQKLTFLQQLIKPMTTMMTMMKTMMFGSTKSVIAPDPVEIKYDFSTKPMNLTLAVTNDGTQVDRFETFKLTGLRSTYGDMVNECSVKKSPGMFSWSSWTDTFYASKGTISTAPHTNGSIDTHGEWVNWCQQANNNKGMFDYLMNWSTGGIFNPFNWMQGMWSAFTTFLFGDYSIIDFKNVLKRGLILDLKKETLDPVNTLNTTTIKLINVKH